MTIVAHTKDGPSVVLGHSAESIRELAMSTLFARLEDLCEGAVAVDRDARVAWINEKYALRVGLAHSGLALGRPIEEIIADSQLREVVRSGKPTVVDIMQLGAEHVVVTRLPLRDERGTLIGAIGFVLYERVDGLKPVIAKMQQLHARLQVAERELADNRRARYSLASFLGFSPAANEIKRQARRAAQLDTNVLLCGETGTGKELLAHAIHHVSRRAARPFVSVNAAAIPESLLEAELFGVAPGAYTGADRRGRDGKFKLADGGTLFLDEVGDLPIALQPKLLRVLQEQEIEPLGANRLLRLDVRVIAASSLDLAQRVVEGRFRADLYYRLAVLTLDLPPLRERLEDMPLLVERLLESIGERLGQPIDIDAEALIRLKQYHWPGNVRELRNTLERALLQGDTPHVAAAHIAAVLPARSLIAACTPTLAERKADSDVRPLAEAVLATERLAIAAALKAHGGSRVAAARALGISRAALYQKLSLHRLT